MGETRYEVRETCRMGVWIICEVGGTDRVSGHFINEYFAQRACDRLNGED